MKYRRKPVVIDAIQWTGDNYAEVFEFTEGNACPAKSHSSTLIVETLEGNMVAEKDCYIIRGVSSTCDDNGSLILSFKDLRGRTFKAVLPKYGWVVREGKTFQFYKDSTFRKTFEEVQKGDNKGIDWEGMNNTIKEAFDGFDEVFKDFKDVFGPKPSKKASGVLSTMVRLNNKGRMAKLIDDLYNGDEKTREEVKKQLYNGLKEMEDSDKTKGTESDTFESVLDEMKELHAKKDKDYSGSFHNLFKEYGMPYALCHIEEKLNRVKAIIANGGNAVTNEHVEDSLIDGACYNILTLIELRNRKH